MPEQSSEIQHDLIDRLIVNWHKALPALNTSGTEIIGRIVRLNHFVSRKVDANLAKYELTVGEFDVLAALRRQKSPYQLTPGQMQELIFISSGGLTNRINRLEKRALIIRLPDPNDRRGVIVQLTKSGKQLIEEIAPTHLEVESAMIGNLSTGEQQQLAGLLKKLLLSQEI